MNWAGFANEAPELAEWIAGEFATEGIALVGTARLDVSPRISPVEPMLVGE